MIDNKTITIQLSEYKELLIIKGKYEELKGLYYGPTYPKTSITYRGIDSIATPATPYEDYTYTAGYCAVKDFKGDDGETV